MRRRTMALYAGPTSRRHDSGTLAGAHRGAEHGHSPGSSELWRARASRHRRSPRPALAGVASLGAGAIHCTAVGLHAEHRQSAVAFALLAAFQLGWGALALFRRGRLLAVVGAVGNAVAVVGWAVAKTKGIGFIDGLETAEGIQWADGLAALLATLAVVGALLSIAPASKGWMSLGHRPGRSRRVWSRAWRSGSSPSRWSAWSRPAATITPPGTATARRRSSPATGTTTATGRDGHDQAIGGLRRHGGRGIRGHVVRWARARRGGRPAEGLRPDEADRSRWGQRRVARAAGPGREPRSR